MKDQSIKYDYLIVGAGIVGMTVAHELLKDKPSSKIAIIEKELDAAVHASGRNSGVLHAGFYYTADSLKAKFTVDGNKRMKEFCHQNGIKVNNTQKVVIAQNDDEVAAIYELEKRGKKNGVNIQIISEQELQKIDDNVNTYKIALYSPDTASVNPSEVCNKLKENLIASGVDFYFGTRFEDCRLNYDYLINCAGLYADKIAHQFGIGKNYTLLPFKGLYLKYKGDFPPTKINVYPVPNLKNPFLGVHYTITADGSVKIGPTAIPALWRENYGGVSGFKFKEMVEVLYYEARLFILNSFNFRSLAIEEMKNYCKSVMIKRAQNMLKKVDGKFVGMPAGIRAQLLDTSTNKLVMDFVVEHGDKSTHVLNAVSPAFTCSFAFAEYIVAKINNNKG